MTDLIEEFYEEVKHIYPDLSINEFRLICNSPFKFTKEVINRGTLRNIRFQYFGVFEVMSSRVKYSLKTLEENYKSKKITEERYSKRKEILDKHPRAKIVAIDAAFTNMKSEEGAIKFRTYGISPGKGIERDLKPLGNVSLVGIVCTYEKNESSESRVLKLINENVTYVNNISETAATLIMRSYENSQIHKQKFLNKLILRISRI